MERVLHRLQRYVGDSSIAARTHARCLACLDGVSGPQEGGAGTCTGAPISPFRFCMLRCLMDQERKSSTKDGRRTSGASSTCSCARGASQPVDSAAAAANGDRTREKRTASLLANGSRQRRRRRAHLHGLQLARPLVEAGLGLAADVSRIGHCVNLCDEPLQALHLAVRPALDAQPAAENLELRRVSAPRRRGRGMGRRRGLAGAPVVNVNYVPAWCQRRTPPPRPSATCAAAWSPAPCSAAAAGRTVSQAFCEATLTRLFRAAAAPAPPRRHLGRSLRLVTALVLDCGSGLFLEPAGERFRKEANRHVRVTWAEHCAPWQAPSRRPPAQSRSRPRKPGSRRRSQPAAPGAAP